MIYGAIKNRLRNIKNVIIKSDTAGFRVNNDTVYINKDIDKSELKEIIQSLNSKMASLTISVDIFKNHFWIFELITPNKLIIEGNYTLSINELLFIYENTKIKIIEVLDIDANAKEILPQLNITVYTQNTIDTLDVQLPLEKSEIPSSEMLIEEIRITEFNSINDVIEFINVLIKQGTTIKQISILCQNDNYENIKDLMKINIPISIYYQTNQLYGATVEEFINMRDTINKLLENIKSKELSELEKVFYTYDIVKTLPTDNTDQEDQNKYLHEIFNYNCITCSEFAELFRQLLNELGINAITYAVDVDTEDIISEKATHQRNLVRIDDEKYNIHAIYAFDPTWDNVNGNYNPLSSYIYSCVNIKQYLNIYRHNSFPNLFILFLKHYRRYVNKKIVQSQIAALFDTDDIQEMFDYVNVPRIGLETFKEVLKIIRLEEGFNAENVDEEIKRTLDENKQIISRFFVDGDDIFFQPLNSKVKSVK